jgi:hypothetical protein
MWDIRMMVRNILDGTFLNLFFIFFVLGPPALLAIALWLLIAPDVRYRLRPNPSINTDAER